MDLQKLKAFVCVAKWRSFTKASAELFISQPALSKKISEFEKELGTTLLIRDNRTVELTEAGQLLYNEAPILLKYGEDLEYKVRALGENPDTTLNIGCTGIEYGRLTDTLNAFRQIHPEISLSLHRNTDPVLSFLRALQSLMLRCTVSQPVWDLPDKMKQGKC